MAAIPSQTYFRFRVWLRLSRFWRYKAIRLSNVDQISQSTAVILILPLPKSKRSPYWNSTSGFHIDLFTVVGMWLCIMSPRHVFCICIIYARFVDNSAVMFLHDWSCRVSTTATLSSPVFQRQHWHRYREHSMRPPDWCSTWNHATMQLSPSANCIG